MGSIIFWIIFFLFGGLGGIITIIRLVTHKATRAVVNTKRNYKIGRRHNDPVKIDNDIFEKVKARYNGAAIPHFYKVVIGNFVIRSEMVKAVNKLQVFARMTITFKDKIIFVKYWWEYVENTKRFIAEMHHHFQNVCAEINNINQHNYDQSYFKKTRQHFEAQSRAFCGVLEIPYKSNLEVIKSAYRKLAKKYHPDLNRDNIEWAETKMKKINEAYTFLKTELSMKT